MTDLHPADFYTGLVADLYEPLRGFTPEPGEYVDLVRRYGQPALELGCGGGDPLVALRLAGLDVEGMDSSGDMLEVCRAKAAAAGVEVALYEQRMEELDLPRVYPLIFVAGPTFTLLVDDDTALAALRRIHAHLTPGGVAWIPLFVPDPLGPEERGMTRTSIDTQGREISVRFAEQTRDEDARLQRTVLVYERGDERAERVWELHWHAREGFTALAEQAGLTVDAVLDDAGEPASVDETSVTFVLSRD